MRIVIKFSSDFQRVAPITKLLSVPYSSLLTPIDSYKYKNVIDMVAFETPSTGTDRVIDLRTLNIYWLSNCKNNIDMITWYYVTKNKALLWNWRNLLEVYNGPFTSDAFTGIDGRVGQLEMLSETNGKRLVKYPPLFNDIILADYGLLIHLKQNFALTRRANLIGIYTINPENIIVLAFGGIG